VKVQCGDKPERWLNCDDFLLFFGLATNASAYNVWSLESKGSLIPVEPLTCATSLQAVYAVGDVADYPGKLKLILTDFAEAAIAARQVYRHCCPDEELFFESSTTQGQPGS
jgi:thioredoxin reductase (NADPH)